MRMTRDVEYAQLNLYILFYFLSVFDRCRLIYDENNHFYYNSFFSVANLTHSFFQTIASDDK